MKKLPLFLTISRVVLAPVSILFVYLDWLGWPYLALLGIAALSDYYDGVLARKYGVATAGLRQFDSIADTIFFVAVLIGMNIAYPQVVHDYLGGIVAVIGLEAFRYVVDYLKFGRGASYHAYSAKIFGFFLLIATVTIMGFGVASPYFTVALLSGIVSEVEGLFISLILPSWRYDIKHVGIAVKIRNDYLNS